MKGDLQRAHAQRGARGCLQAGGGGELDFLGGAETPTKVLFQTPSVSRWSPFWK